MGLPSIDKYASSKPNAWSA